MLGQLGSFTKRVHLFNKNGVGAGGGWSKCHKDMQGPSAGTPHQLLFHLRDGRMLLAVVLNHWGHHFQWIIPIILFRFTGGKRGENPSSGISFFLLLLVFQLVCDISYRTEKRKKERQKRKRDR